MSVIEIKTTEPTTVAYITERGSYDKIPEAMGRLYRWLTEKGLTPAGMPSGVYLTSPATTPEQDAVWELHAPVAGDPPEVDPDQEGRGIKRIEPHLVAAAVHRGPYDTVSETYEELETWVAETHHLFAGPPEELYLSDPDEVPPEEYLTEVRLPIAS